MIKTREQATLYILQSIQNMEGGDPKLEDNAVLYVIEDALEDTILTKVENQLTVKDLQNLEENIEQDEFLEEYLQKNIPNYQEILEESISEIITEYMTEK